MTPDLFPGGGALRPLRPHQESALAALRASLAGGHRRPMLQAPTGFGKTLTAAHIINRALDRGRRVCFTVPALSLIDQTLNAFEAEGLDHIGVIQGLHPRVDPGAPIQIASVQTLQRRALPDVDLALIDEAHLSFKSVFEWMRQRPDVRFVGLSATPWTRGLGRYYDDLIIATTTADLIAGGFLAPFVAFAPGAPDLSGVSTVAGDFHEGQLAEACDKIQLVGDVITTWHERAFDLPTLCYGVNRAHALHLAQRFIEAGVCCEYIDGNTDRADRERIFDRFRSGIVRVICNVATLAVGIDLDVRCIIDARPTKSEMRFVQTIGRGLRTAEGKDRLIILDHAGNHLRLGMVTDIHHDTLDAGERKAPGEGKRGEAALPYVCEACKTVLPRAVLRCTSCGAVRESKSAIVAVEGELVELGSGDPSRSHNPTLSDQADFFGELLFIAQERGYSSGWAAHKFREKFGTWPRHPWIKAAEPTPPSLKTKSWVRSRAIAFAKGRAAHG